MTPSDSDSDRDSPTDSGRTIEEQAVAWFVRLRSDTLPEEDRRTFESWRRENPAHRRAYDEVCRLWDDQSLKAAAASAAAVEAVLPVTRHRTSVRTRRLWQWAAVAAVCAVAMVVAYQLDIVVRLKADHRTATGEQLQIELPDRSTATLNTKSAIAVSFDGIARKVRLLDGEAFFQVEPDRDRPFLVEGQQVVSRAVGTKFLVRRRSNEIRVTVVEGIVEVASTEGGWEPLQLTAGRQTAVDSHVMGPVHDVDVRAATAWLRGRLVFDNVRLADVIDEIRRYHRGVIVIWGSTIGDLRVSGSYTLTDTDEILTTLSQTLPIHMARLGSRVVALF